MVGLLLGQLSGCVNPGAMFRITPSWVKDVADKGCQLVEEVRFLVLKGKRQGDFVEPVFLSRLQ